MPDGTARKVSDLLARERLAAETMSAHEQVSHDSSKSVEERTIANGLAAVERERIAQIRADLATLVR